MAVGAYEGEPVYTVVQADGLYQDDKVELEILSPRDGSRPYQVRYLEANLWPDGNSPAGKPWSSIDAKLREQIDAITILRPGMTAEDIALFPNLKLVVRMGVGYDKVDRSALAQQGVTLCNVPDYGTCEIADHALALALSLRRGITLHHDTQRADPPADWAPIETAAIQRISGTTFGILGLGAIGMAAATRAKAFGWNVLFYDPFTPSGFDKALGIERTKDIKELFRRSSTLSVHCPLTADTRDMVNMDLLKLMPKGAILINTARGEIVNLCDIQTCLKSGQLSAVGLDVATGEPNFEAGIHPLLQAYRQKEPWLQGKMILTPHSAWHCPQSLWDVRTKTAETVRDVLINKMRTNIIPPSRW